MSNVDFSSSLLLAACFGCKAGNDASKRILLAELFAFFHSKYQFQILGLRIKGPIESNDQVMARRPKQQESSWSDNLLLQAQRYKWRSSSLDLTSLFQTRNNLEIWLRWFGNSAVSSFILFMHLLMRAWHSFLTYDNNADSVMQVWPQNFVLSISDARVGST